MSYAYSWNGPICGTCGAMFLDSHRCSATDLIRRINELVALLANVDPVKEPTAGCPCRPENGGNGVCGCILNSLKVT